MSMITEFYLAVAVGLILSIAMEEFLGISSVFLSYGYELLVVGCHGLSHEVKKFHG